MSTVYQPTVRTLGLFEKRIEGDDSLMELARQRFQQAGMGAELHAGTPEQLDGVMRFRPSEHTVAVVHLPRDFNLLDPHGRKRIADLAARYAGRVYGFVLHDHGALMARREDYLQAAWDLDDQLEKIPDCPLLFVEYAVGLEPADFAAFFAAIRDLDRISACIDNGHVGIRQARAAYARTHGGEDVCALRSQEARLPQLLDDVEAAVRTGPEAVHDLIGALGALGKPLHFHLHDGHPLSNFSPFGVADHLSFLTDIPIGFDYRGQRALAPMYGPEGLARLLARALEATGDRGFTATLEIHPTGERLPLGEAGALFDHWVDKTNAEKMNHWLSVLARNHRLLRQALREAAAPPAPRLEDDQISI